MMKVKKTTKNIPKHQLINDSHSGVLRRRKAKSNACGSEEAPWRVCRGREPLAVSVV